jgi:hypothetical protein
LCPPCSSSCSSSRSRRCLRMSLLVWIHSGHGEGLG